MVMTAYRSSMQESTKYSPNFLMFGREVNLPLNLMYQAPEQNEYDPDSYAKHLQNCFEKSFQAVREHLGDVQLRQKRRYDTKKWGQPYTEGDDVWLYVPARKRGLSPKLQHFWQGPCKIVKQISDAVYRIKRLDTGKKFLVHFDRLKPCYSPPPQVVSEENVNMPFDNAEGELNYDQEHLPLTTCSDPDAAPRRRLRRMPVWTKDYDMY